MKWFVDKVDKKCLSDMFLQQLFLQVFSATNNTHGFFLSNGTNGLNLYIPNHGCDRSCILDLIDLLEFSGIIGTPNNVRSSPPSKSAQQRNDK